MNALMLPAEESSNGEFNPPGIDDAGLPGAWFAWDGIGKYHVLIVLSVILIAVFFLVAGRKKQLVPGRLQFAGEIAYGFVRNSIAKDIIGGRDFIKYVPMLFTLFFFIVVNNMFGAIPIAEIPTFSHVGGAYVLAGVVYLTWIILGIKKNGFRYFKLSVVPSGVPGYLLVMVVPIEIISNYLVRPMTHSLRLFATMLAGHMIVLMAGYGTEFLIMQENVLLKGASLLVIAGFLGMYFLELLIMFLQAYVFTLLTATYIEGAIHADAH
ncbi:F0F1 ATP synthase subunit A [Psychromicrobium lacuslunae]|uniref:ATP synthase subunit a n=1 Tax=Psychromicrobium lacuslunae TaxID=1618207 RepID=A0A0D4BYX7_9MICC|nr:F0F1 ATP synthase subunit A [Psychromicrobium lacuslunae]AJT41350.1 ATP synthase subunit A [Psychromicrobium lacuslunae]